jgi:hypothetical protein
MEIADPRFDAIFDPFRPDREGTPASAWEAASFPPPDVWKCRSAGNNRLDRLSCAVYALGTLLGSTLAHEIGHSLGLAQPYVEGAYHNPGDAPLRLMDDGNARYFEGAGPVESGLETFCDEDFRYLRAVLGDRPESGHCRRRPGCGRPLTAVLRSSDTKLWRQTAGMENPDDGRQTMGEGCQLSFRLLRKSKTMLVLVWPSRLRICHRTAANAGNGISE